MQITVFGASGKVGRRVVALALERGNTVIAFVHSHDPFVRTPNLIVQKGDVYSSEDVAKAIKGSDAVVSCLGSWGTKKRNVLTAAMRAIIPAMEQQKVTRIVTLTGSGANAPDQEPSKSYVFMMKLLAPFPVGKIFSDGAQHMELLAISSLNWTTVRSPIMNNGANIGYKLGLKPGSALATINRQAVVVALLDQLESTEYSYQAPIISRK
jgi:putative NADH-flavin reductase